MGMAAAVVDQRKRVSIESLLHWTYREELPKGYEHKESFGPVDSSISPMFRLAALGTKVDFTAEPGFPVAMGLPHPDALLIDAAVQRLPSVGLEWRAARPRLMHDLLHWVSDSDPILSSMSFEPHALLVIHAKMGTRPIWDLGAPRVERITNPANGQPVIQHIDEETGELVHGRTAGHRYGAMARCPLTLEPNPREIACARAEYLVWHQALCHVKQVLETERLHDHDALAPTAAPEPWIIDTEPKPRILRSLQRLRVVS